MERHKWLMVKCVIVFRTIRRGMTAGEQRNLATKKYIDQEIQTWILWENKDGNN